MNSKRFENMSVVISGAAKGIGFACAEKFILEGAQVAILDIDEATGKNAARKLGPNAHFFRCDVSDRKSVEKNIGALIRRQARIDVLVNNAAIHLGKSFFDLTEKDFENVLRTNVMGAFHLTQLLAKQMIKQLKGGGKPGAVVNIASVNAQLALPDAAAYCASKGALLQLTRASALALAPYGIRVNAAGPGSISTASNTERTDPAKKQRVMARTPLRRLGTSQEIADIVAFLASNEATYITGQIIYADGGRLALNYTTY